MPEHPDTYSLSGIVVTAATQINIGVPKLYPLNAKASINTFDNLINKTSKLAMAFLNLYALVLSQVEKERTLVIA